MTVASEDEDKDAENTPSSGIDAPRKKRNIDRILLICLVVGIVLFIGRLACIDFLKFAARSKQIEAKITLREIYKA